MNCRHCRKLLEHVFLDLGTAPPANAYLSPADLQKPELYYPLKLYVCDRCWLVQTEDYTASEDLFRPDYAYFSSTSTTWLEHAASYTEMICKRLGLEGHSFVLEIGANDGYLLKNFLARGIPCLGIEPTAGTATAAERLGISIVREFFGMTLARRLAEEGLRADLIVGNNVFAHVPDINDFTAGLQQVLHPEGTVTLEFPHLLRLMEETQFDTIYHEHFSYLSLYTVDIIFRENGLKVYDVEQLSTHGGSLRVYGCHVEHGRKVSAAVANLIELESRAGLRGLAAYCGFQERADKVKDDLLVFLVEHKKMGKNVAGYGAAAKGNTLLNYAGVKPNLLPFVCDAAPSKQGKYLPGSRIPIKPPAALREHKPDYVLVLPWNIAGEVMQQHGYVADWEGVFVVAVPSLRELK